MGMPHKMIPARHSQGLAAYRGGQTLSDLTETLNQIDAMHETAESREAHEEIAAAGPSLIVGYLDGFLEDFRDIARALAGRRNNLRA